MKHLIYLILVFSFISCENEGEKNVASISLDQTEIVFESIGGISKVKLTTGDEWEVKNVPEWISLDQYNGKASSEIIITSEANETSNPREAEILFICYNQSVTLTINQTQKTEELAWSSLCFSQFDDVSFILGNNDVERIYSFSTRQLFLNPSLTANTEGEFFLGNLVNRSLKDNKNIEVYKGYTFNPITAFTTIGTEKSRTFMPSKSAQDDFVDQILSNKPTQSESFLVDGSGVVYNSHRELNLIGVGNMGVNLDEVVSNNSYQEQEMTKKNGIIYSFSHTLFTLNMDMQEHIVKEQISKNDFPNNSISYISGISYGRIGLLIIESDYSIDKIRSIVNKILQRKSEAFTLEDTAVSDELSAYHLYYDKSQKLKIATGKKDVIEAYNNQITDDLFNVFPFKIMVSDYFERGESNMYFNIDLP